MLDDLTEYEAPALQEVGDFTELTASNPFLVGNDFTLGSFV